MIAKPTNSITLPLILVALVIGVAFYVTDRKQWTIDKQKFLLEVHNQENRLLLAQMQDYEQQIYQSNYEEYRRGYDEGRAHVGIAMMEGESMLNYSDGYHAALTQFGDMDLSVVPDTISSTFLTLYHEALTDGNKSDAVFYKDMMLSHLDEELTRKFTAESDSPEVELPLPVSNETPQRVELLEKLEDAQPNLEEVFRPYNKQE